MHIQSRKESGLCNFLCKRFSKKCFTQIYMVLNEDAMLVSLWGSQIWQLEATTSPTRTVQTAQSQQLSHLLTYVTAFKYRATLRKLINSTLWYQKMKDLKNWNLLKDKSSAVLVTNLTKISRIDNSFFFFFQFWWCHVKCRSMGRIWIFFCKDGFFLFTITCVREGAASRFYSFTSLTVVAGSLYIL